MNIAWRIVIASAVLAIAAAVATLSPRLFEPTPAATDALLQWASSSHTRRAVVGQRGEEEEVLATCKGSYENVDGHAIFVRESLLSNPLADDDSAACTLLLLHGYPTSSIDFQPLWQDIEALAARLGCESVLAPDLLGFGLSAKPATMKDISLLSQTTLVEKVLSARGATGSIHIIAHDYSVSIAQELAARHIHASASNRSGSEPADVNIRSIVLFNGGMFYSAQRPTLTQQIVRRYPVISQVLPKFAFKRAVSKVFGSNKPTDEWLETAWAAASYNGGRRLLGPLLAYLNDRRDNEPRWKAATDTLVRATLARHAPRVNRADNIGPALCLVNGPADPVSGINMANHVRETWPEFEPHVHILSSHVGHWPFLEAAEESMAAIHTCYTNADLLPAAWGEGNG